MGGARIPPYDAEAEKAVLGSVLLDNGRWGDVFTILSASDFFKTENRLIFSEMERLFSAGTPVDVVTLASSLNRAGESDKVGGIMYIAHLQDAVGSSANAAHYAASVREKSAMRDIIAAAQAVVENGFGAKDSVVTAESIDRLVNASNNLSRTRMPDSLLSMGGDVLRNYELVESGFRGIELPWPTVDRMTAGLWPKTVTMFVARPGTGKTMIAVIAGRHAWMKGKRVLIISPEMSKLEIAERFFVIHSEVSYAQIISGTLPTMQKARLKSSASELEFMSGLWIMDSDDELTTRNMEAAIRACRPDLVAIDSIYDIKFRGDRKDRALVALEWMKRCSKDMNFAVVGFAQQNRGAEQSEKKGGGSRLGTIALADEIGQDAHAVFALEQDKDDKADRKLHLRPLKLRRGQFKKPRVTLNWDFDMMDFSEVDEEQDEAPDAF